MPRLVPVTLRPYCVTRAHIPCRCPTPLFAGDISAHHMSNNAYPATEPLFQWPQLVGVREIRRRPCPWQSKKLIIGAHRNWSRNVLRMEPGGGTLINTHTSEGCSIRPGGRGYDKGSTVYRKCYLIK